MDGQISAESLIEALQVQRNEAMDTSAKLTAYTKSLEKMLKEAQDEKLKLQTKVAALEASIEKKEESEEIIELEEKLPDLI